MSDKNKIQGYYNPKTKQNEYKPIVEDYTPVDYGTTSKTAPQQNRSTTKYIVIIVILAIFSFLLFVSWRNGNIRYNQLSRYTVQLEKQIEDMEKSSAASKTKKVEETVVTTIYEIEEDKSTKEVTVKKVGESDIGISCMSAKLDYGKENNPILLVEYEFTNNTNENIDWLWDVTDKAFQGGVECGGNVYHNDINNQMHSNEIQPGTTVTIVEGYPLYDDTSAVTIECSELFGDEPMLVVDIKLV
jgi:hypothetical protein